MMNEKKNLIISSLSINTERFYQNKFLMLGFNVLKMFTIQNSYSHYMRHYNFPVKKIELRNQHAPVIGEKTISCLNTGLKRCCFEKNILKLLNNAIFGKTTKNIGKQRDIRVVLNKKTWIKLVFPPSKILIYEFCYECMIRKWSKTNMKYNYLDSSFLKKLINKDSAAKRIADDIEEIYDKLNYAERKRKKHYWYEKS